MNDKFKKLISKNLSAMQRHDVYEVDEVEEITDEIAKAMGELKEEKDLIKKFKNKFKPKSKKTLES